MKANGVEKTVIIQVIHYRWDNSYLADVLKRYPSYFRGVARVNPESPAAPDDLSRLVEQQGFRGVRISPDQIDHEDMNGYRNHPALTAAVTDEAGRFAIHLPALWYVVSISHTAVLRKSARQQTCQFTSDRCDCGVAIQTRAR